MSHANHEDVIAQLASAGLIIDKPLALDASFQRWLVEGEDREKRGWSRLSTWPSPRGHSYIVGVFGVWHGNDDGRRKIELQRRDGDREASAEEQRAIREAQREAARRLDQVRKAEALTAAQWAQAVWSGCRPASSSGEHEYLLRKGIQPHGARLLSSLEGIPVASFEEGNARRLAQSVGALVVPMHDARGLIAGLQFIYPSGHAVKAKTGRDKTFWPSGMAMGGSFGVIGAIRREGVLLIAEGFATAATLHESTGLPCAYAFSANNLCKVGRALTRQHARARLLFCADDDYLTEGNPGVEAASGAAAAIERADWVKPDFTGEDGADRREGRKLTDFNDLAQLAGVPVSVSAQIAAKLDALGWREGAARASVPITGGAGHDEEPGSGRHRACAVMGIEDLVARFVPLDDGTGKHVFDLWTNRVASRDQMIALLPAGVRADDIKRHPVWIERGAFYLEQVGFDPSGQDSEVKLNTWRGWPMQPKEGKCEMILELLRYLCSEDEHEGAIYTWLLRWMAYPLQRPGAKLASAVIMHGPQGTGKSAVFQCLAKIYGPYATVLNQRGLEDRFNSDWAADKLFILAEEVVARSEMWHIKNELKELVTGERIRVNPKNIAAHYQKNQIQIVYLSNEGQPLPLENDDRRHLVVYTPPALTEQFYDEVFLEIENGGIAALYDYLLKLDLGDFHAKKRPPMTQAKRELIALSLPSDARFATDYVLGELDLPVCPCLATDFYAAYLRWCRANGEPRPRPSNLFLGAVSRLEGWSKRKCRIFDDAKVPGPPRLRPIVFPPEAALQRFGTAQPPAEPQERWLTASYIKFRTALRGAGEEEGRWAA